MAASGLIARPYMFLLGLAVALLLGFGALFPREAEASEPAPNPGTANFEVRFLSTMIDHHAMAIEMGQLCLQKATHEELISLCSNIVRRQSQQMVTMQSWLAAWYGVTHEPEMKPGDMKQMERLSELSGAEFEIEFMQMMSQHHAKAVREASHCLDRAYHDDLQALCVNIVQTQTAEIQLMQGWLCEWYGICRRGH